VHFRSAKVDFFIAGLSLKTPEQPFEALVTPLTASFAAYRFCLYAASVRMSSFFKELGRYPQGNAADERPALAQA
jgi:hypothetical protein